MIFGPSTIVTSKLGSCHRAAIAAIVVALITSLAIPVRAQSADSPLTALRNAESAVAELIARVEPSIVAIGHGPAVVNRVQERPGVLRFNADPFGGLRKQRATPPPATSGAGVVIGDGLILTQYLAINPGAQHSVTTIEGATLDATIKGADPRSGLAVLEVKDVELPVLPIGQAETLQKGRFVLTLGNPFAIVSDGQPTAGLGTVANLGRRVGSDVNLNNTSTPGLGYRTTLHHFGTLIQTDAKLGWSAAGGALVNLEGELVGVATTASTIAGHERPAGYAIPLNKTFRRIVDTLKEGREVEYGMLGIEFSPNTRGEESAGVRVNRSIAGGPAARAGLRNGDVITEIDDQPIRSAEDLQLAVGSLPPNTPTPIKFLRNGVPQSTPVSLAKFFVPGKKVVTVKTASWQGIRVDYSTSLPTEKLRASSARGEIDPRGCVVVSEVAPGSISWKSGVRPGMFISHVGETRVTSPDEFFQAVKNADKSAKLRFTSGGDKPAP